MRYILILLQHDSIFFLRWFQQHLLSKFFVLIGFSLIGGFFLFTSYFLSSLFFRNLASYQQFGALTAEYLLHGALLLFFWFFIGTGIVSILTLLLSSDRRRDFLLTLPISLAHIIGWIFVRSSLVNLLFLTIVVTPVILAYIQAFPIDIFFLFRYAIVLLILVLWSNSIGSFIGFFIAPFVKGRGILSLFFGVLFFISTAVVLLRLLFPAKLFQLAAAPIEQFVPLYQSLPLVNPMVPTYWLTNFLTHGDGISFSLMLISTVVLFLLSFSYQVRTGNALLQVLHIHVSLPGRFDQRLLTSRYPLFYKDWLSIKRLPTESGYMIFLVCIGIFFFLMLWLARIRQEHISEILLLFAFVWLLFFTTAYLLRLVYPLMAREGRTAWFFFTVPVARQRLFFQKVFFGFLLSLPYIVFSGLLWIFMPYAFAHKPLLIMMSVISVTSLAVFMSIAGVIAPQFAEGEHPENVSTSAPGVIVFIIAVLFTVLQTYLLYLVQQGILTGMFGMLLSAEIGLLLVMSALLAGMHAIQRYQF